MNAFVAVTDAEWFRFLSGLSDVDDVNFWQPSARTFRVLQVGEPLLFKLHAPESFIVGGGFFVRWSPYPCSIAWEVFGQKNGAATLEEMRRRIERYRRAPASNEDYEIGCIVLSQPFFFDRADWFPPPDDFHPNIQTGKRYERRCAITGEKILPVLQAAHIRPVTAEGLHRVDNGLLFRSDVHTLFDTGYATVTPDYRFRVSRRLRDDFHNGEYYLTLDQREIWVPPRTTDRPDRAALEWHSDTVFRA